MVGPCKKHMRKVRSKYWEGQITTMFQTDPETKKIQYRYNAIRYLLKLKYPQIAELPKETFLEMLKEASYLERKLRQRTEGLQKGVKKTLSEEYQVEELGYGGQITLQM